MVVCYHVWFHRVSGGVDIFLLVSAFLLTGSFARKLETGRGLRIPQYWLHAFRRLVPPAALTIVLTLGASLLILPSTRWLNLLEESIASLIYGQNWLLVARSVDYFDPERTTASPLQHFWSLSIQGQVFLIWPLLIGLVGLAARRLRLPVRGMLMLVFALIGAASLGWSVVETSQGQPQAYFDTFTRLWEFALGSLLALALPSIERRLGFRQHADPRRGRWRRTRAAIGWIGLVLILACGWVVDVQGSFPGWIALWPLLAAALVIVAGPTGTTWGADRLLSSRPLRWLGDISYGLYLLHWPVLIIVLEATGATRATPALGTAIVLGSVVLACALTVGVDTPIRRSAVLDQHWWRGALVIATSALLVITSVGTVRVVLDATARSAEQQSAEDNPGARSLLPGYVPAVAEGSVPLPPLHQLPEDYVRPTGDCPDLDVTGDLAAFCSTVVPQDDPAAPLVVVAGNSHAMQALPMIAGVAGDRGWRLVTVARPACSFGVVDSQPWCAEYNRAVIDFLERVDADALVTYSTYAGIPGEGGEAVSEGFEPSAAEVLDAGIPILGLRDNPRLRETFDRCLGDGVRCSMPVSASLAAEDPGAEAARELDARAADDPTRARMTQVDLTPWVCPRGRCVPKIGNVYTYLDDNHLSATYSATLAPALAAELDRSGFEPA